MGTEYLRVRLGLEMEELDTHASSACTDQEGGQEVASRKQDFPALVPCIPDPQEGGFLRFYGVLRTGEVACVHNEELRDPT